MRNILRNYFSAFFKKKKRKKKHCQLIRNISLTAIFRHRTLSLKYMAIHKYNFVNFDSLQNTVPTKHVRENIKTTLPNWHTGKYDSYVEKYTNVHGFFLFKAPWMRVTFLHNFVPRFNNYLYWIFSQFFYCASNPGKLMYGNSLVIPPGRTYGPWRYFDQCSNRISKSKGFPYQPSATYERVETYKADVTY